MSTEEKKQQTGETEPPRHRIRLPVFIKKGEEVRLGDTIYRVTHFLNIPHCPGCAQRRAALNRWSLRG